MFGAQRADGRRRTRTRTIGALASLALVAASCGGSDDGDAEPEDSTAPPAEEPVDSTPAEEPPADDPPAEDPPAEDPPAEDPPAEDPPAEDPPAEDPPAEDPPAASGDQSWTSAFPDLPPPTGEELVLGMVNTEGAPGLDFPDIRTFSQATIDYLNERGGFGNRPVRLEACIANGSPEASQACAQELSGKDVELVFLGLDVFPDYATFDAAGLPLIGMLPLTPLDNNTSARYLTGGNVTTNGAFANVAQNYFEAETIGIVSADNAGANATLAGLEAALDLAGIEYTSVKGGDNETDAGFQGLTRQAAEGNPDLLVSLYADAGCIGMMRGRASLGIEIPVLTTSLCANADVIDEVGDDALGWHFVGISTQEDTPELAILQEILSGPIGVEPSEVDSTAIGLGGLGFTSMLSIAGYANLLAESGGEVTGQGIYDFLGESDDLTFWPGITAIDCGFAPEYSSICAFDFPVAAYTESGEVLTVPGLEAVSSVDFLP